MLSKIIRLLFPSNVQSNSIKANDNLTEIESDMKIRTLNAYFLDELEIESIIPKSKYTLVLAHLNHESKLTDSIISSEFQVNEEEIKHINKVVRDIYYKGSCEKAWDDNFIKSHKSGIKEAILRSSGTNNHCDYCRSRFDKKIDLSINTFFDFKKNCMCIPYKKSHLEPIITFD